MDTAGTADIIIMATMGEVGDMVETMLADDDARSRKVVQIVAATGFGLYALCDDGTLWRMMWEGETRTWEQIETP